MKVHVEHSSPIVRSGRVMQVEGLFDVPPSERAVFQHDVDLPLDERPWNVGLIVGPSGSGKSTLARAAFGDALVERFEWPTDRAIIDAFPGLLSTKDVVGLLTSVGFGSPPSWLRPFSTLSNGEQFRANMARALAENPSLAVVDEFTSVVDRQVAKVASSAVAKAVRRADHKLVAVSCHFDIVDWLQPDWVYQPHEAHFVWRSLQRRPPIELSIHPVSRSCWPLFARHHYLNTSLSGAAQCFGAFVGDQIVAFTSHTHFPHPSVRNIRHAHRLVVLPDWQGVGIAGRLADWLGDYLWQRGYRYRFVVANPAMIAMLQHSPRWEYKGRGGNMQTGPKSTNRARHMSSRTLNTHAFEYRPPAGTTRPDDHERPRRHGQADRATAQTD